MSQYHKESANSSFYFLFKPIIFLSKVLVIQTKPLMQHIQLLHDLTHICTMFFFPFSHLWKDFGNTNYPKRIIDVSYVYVYALTTTMGQNWKHTGFTDTFLNFVYLTQEQSYLAFLILCTTILSTNLRIFQRKSHQVDFF